MSLYDGGVLSPAVLERLLVSFSQANPDWETEPTERSVDGRSLHEVVTLIMMPGEPLRTARKSFISIIGHLAQPGANKSPRASAKAKRAEDEESSDSDDDSADSAELAAQLSGRAPAGRRGGKSKTQDAEASAAKSARPAGFNPLFNAAGPRRNKN